MVIAVLTFFFIVTSCIYIDHRKNMNSRRSFRISNPGEETSSGETFEIIEGEVNKRTKYWKFIALYENSLKKVKGKMNEKRLVQVPYNIMSLKNLLQDFW